MHERIEQNVQDSQINSDGFADRVSLLITEAGGYASFAHSCGVSESVARKWSKDASDPARRNLIAIAKARNVNLLWLATGEGEMRPGEADIEVQVERRYPHNPARTIEQMKEGVAERRTDRERRAAEPPLNPQLLLEVIEAVETNLNQRDLEMRPDRKALLIQLLYEHQMDARLNKEDTTKRFFELIGK